MTLPQIAADAQYAPLRPSLVEFLGAVNKQVIRVSPECAEVRDLVSAGSDLEAVLADRPEFAHVREEYGRMLVGLCVQLLTLPQAPLEKPKRGRPRGSAGKPRTARVPDGARDTGPARMRQSGGHAAIRAAIEQGDGGA